MKFFKILSFSRERKSEKIGNFSFSQNLIPSPASAPTKLRPSEHVHCTVWANWRSWICRATEFRPLRPEPSKAWTAFKGFIYIPIVWRPWVQEICQFPYMAFQFTKTGMWFFFNKYTTFFLVFCDLFFVIKPKNCNFSMNRFPYLASWGDFWGLSGGLPGDYCRLGSPK